MSQSGFDTKLVKDLARILRDTDLSEIEVENEGVRVRVARQANIAPQMFQAHVPMAQAPMAMAPAAANSGSWANNARKRRLGNVAALFHVEQNYFRRQTAFAAFGNKTWARP